MSPSSARIDRVRKTAIYLDSGVPFLWLISPVEQLLEVFEATGGRWLRL